MTEPPGAATREEAPAAGEGPVAAGDGTAGPGGGDLVYPLMPAGGPGPAAVNGAAVPAMEPLPGAAIEPLPGAAIEPLRVPGDDPALQPQTASSLTSELLLPARRPGSRPARRRRRPTGLTGLREPAGGRNRQAVTDRIRTPVAAGHHRVAVLSLKGGVGKTTTAFTLGATLAAFRGDRVIAVDANPDRGTLSDKIRLETPATIRDLVSQRSQIRRYADLRAYISQAPSRLEVLASDRDPGVSVALSAEEYRAAAELLEQYYSICLTDCGTGLLHSAMSAVLELADQIVVVSSPSVDGARAASATLDWLEAHEYEDLVRGGVVVLSMVRPKSRLDLGQLQRHFADRCRGVVRIPFDPHLEEGGEVDLELLAAGTADAYLALAALVGDGLAGSLEAPR